MKTAQAVISIVVLILATVFAAAASRPLRTAFSEEFPGVAVVIEKKDFAFHRKQSELLRDLRSRPTPGLSNRDKFAMVLSSRARCNKFAREVFYFHTACQMKRAMPQITMSDACSRAEAARQALSLALDMEVVAVEGPGGSPGEWIPTEPGALQRAFERLVEVPSDCD